MIPDVAPPINSFASDNAAGVTPEVMDALVRANAGPALAYGEDRWTRELAGRMCELFDHPVETLLCWGGTGANVAGLASVIQPWQAIVAADSAHIVVDECGAPTRFSGAPTLTVANVDGKLRASDLDPFLAWLGTEHHPQVAVVSISQATEMGTVYTSEEIAHICDHAHASGVLVHVDGARISNALVAEGTDLRTAMVDTGVDLMTFGLTKNGAMYGEAVVHLRPALAEHSRFVRKQAGQLVSKSRFVAAQMLALLDDDRWLRHAGHANEMAALLAERVAGIEGVVVDRMPEANSVFARLPAAAVEELQAWSFFWVWDPSIRLVRWMTSFATTPEDIERFAVGIEQCLENPAE